MDYKEKYIRALERARDLMTNQNPPAFDKDLISLIFPELKESEDEQIRKRLIRVFGSQVKEKWGGIPTADILTWLEKQEEPKDKGEISDGYHTFNELYRYRLLYNAAFFNLLPKELVHKSKRHHDGEECFGGGWFIVMANLPTGQISNHYELKDWDLFQIPEKYVADKWDGHTPQEAADRLHKYLLEKHGEQPTDKVEPKFKVGDWIILPLGIIAHIDSLNSTDYQVATTDGKICDFKISKQDNYRLWTIQDAKDGDVLYSIDSKQPFIYKERPQFSQARGYCCINKFGEFAVWNTIKCVICTDKYIPATKEQRDTLFAKMKEAGYEWDGEKKELKKIEPKMLNAEEVIEWLKTKVYDDSAYGKAMIKHFKKDLGL